MQLATLDERGYPNTQPVWFYYDKIRQAMHQNAKGHRKVPNIKGNPNKVCFSINDENYPYKGVKVRGKVSIS